MASNFAIFTICYLCALILLLAHMILTSGGGEIIKNKAKKEHLNYPLE